MPDPVAARREGRGLAGGGGEAGDRLVAALRARPASEGDRTALRRAMDRAPGHGTADGARSTPSRR
ncbi:hypothetical protein [Streptomyces yaizuensis]|uniref:Uncharacterized protein n=1 Tax=Streptomyces yaizuensis TaxID=2989713 RepID=A0ABQ5P2N0_9ACTN|nr:hypothetical protein [Streptomyces sp. YSPA8]GLF96851.1 hypothetical protein SYYSPA8_21160 [Streptomyces sp. YSPA8]